MVSGSLDPVMVAAQVIGNALLSAAEQMAITLIKTAYSPNINERQDCSTAIFDQFGNVVAQAPRIPLHLGSMLGLVQETLKRHADGLKPGDMFVANDPYGGGGSHLPDITLVAPVFWEGELVSFIANIAHHSDVGGMSPGSETALASEIMQEGLRLPPMRIVDGGSPVTDVIDLIALNSRAPEERVGDLWAQISANDVGRREVESILRQWGATRTLTAMQEQLNHAERRFRARVSALEDGEYVAELFLDNDGVNEAPVPIRVRITVAEDDLSVDFTGSAGQLGTSRNVPPTAVLAVVFCVLKSYLDHSLPANSGYFRAVDVVMPAGSIVNPKAPAAIGQRAYTCQVISDVLVLALNKAVPDFALAGSGTFLGATFSGVDPQTGAYFVDHESWAGALGAQTGRDGLDAVRVHHSNAANLPIEYLEAAYPYRIERYELVQDSGGDGQWRGGLGTRREYRVLAPTVRVSLFGERRIFPPPGVLGGGDGRCGRFVVISKLTGESRELNTKEMLDITLYEGDLLRVETPGGGGYGKPRDRDPERVRLDVIEDKISPGGAARTYGLETEYR
jgi:N-methylhydantoinase B